MPSKYQQHLAKWQGCTKCDLHKYRKQVVLLRGKAPADIAFVGEAPGDSEDILGVPFVGPAGQLLDRMVIAAGLDPKRCAFLNLLACIPRVNVEGKVFKASTPPPWAIEACEDRYLETLALVNPKLAILVGQEAQQHGFVSTLQTAQIIHPAAILRMHVSQQGLAFQRNVIAIKDAVEQMEGWYV